MQKKGQRLLPGDSWEVTLGTLRCLRTVDQQLQESSTLLESSSAAVDAGGKDSLRPYLAANLLPENHMRRSFLEAVGCRGVPWGTVFARCLGDLAA